MVQDRKAVIATYRKPKEGMFTAFVDAFKDAARTAAEDARAGATRYPQEDDAQLELIGVAIVDGSGCFNYGVMTRGTEVAHTHFMDAVTMMLAGKWENTSLTDPGVEEGQFEDYKPSK